MEYSQKEIDIINDASYPATLRTVKLNLLPYLVIEAIDNDIMLKKSNFKLFKMKNFRWKQYFSQTKKNHIVSMQPCPSCGVYYTPQPISEKVLTRIGLNNFECDGCEAYRDHLR